MEQGKIQIKNPEIYTDREQRTKKLVKSEGIYRYFISEQGK